MSVTTMQASGSKPVFTCSECSATYSRMEYLRRHERKHTETRPFQCEECMKSFARSDVLLRHRRRCHPEAEAIREANALLDSQAEGNPVTSPTITSGRAKLRAAGLSKRSQGKTRQPNEPSSSPSEGVLSPELPSLSGDRLMHGPPPPPSQSGSSSTDTSAFAGLDQFFTFAGASTDLTSLTRSSPGAQSLVSADAPSPTSLTSGNSLAPWMALPPLSMFSPNAILPKSASEVNQFGSWYVFPQRQSPTGSGARGSNGQILDLSKNGESSNTEAGAVGPYLLGDGETAEQLELDLLSPERAVFNAEWRVINGKRGPPLPPTDKFFIPPGLFAGCYTIPHWLLPPLTRLSKFAARTLTDHLVRFPLIHQATFKLSETPHWFAFAMCTVGGLNPGETHMKDMMGDTYTFKDSGAPWDGVQSIVRTEKVDMLVKTFVRHSAKLALCDQVSIVQSLLLYNTPAFLSDDASERIIGHLFLGTVVKVIRKSGMFHPSADFASRLTVPADATLDTRWRKWIRHETCRRSAWIVYILDTIASLEAAVPSLVSSRDISHLALPASDSMWSARSDVEWAAFAEAGGYQTEGITLDIALRSVFGYDDAATEGRPDATTGLRLGPFARTVVIMTLLRGLIEFGQGKPRGGVVTNTWITNGLMAAKGMPASHNWIIATYMRALAKASFWREGWDLDPLCMLLSMPQATSPSPSNSTSSPSPAAGSPGDFSQASPSSNGSTGTAFFASTVDTSPTLKEPVFVNDALPYYWLALVLVDMLKPGIAADTAQPQADATNPDTSTGATSLAQVLGNAIPQVDDPNGTGLSGIPDYTTYGGTPIIGARIVDLDEQNDKFADVDFREMLNIAKEFARGDTGTMRSPSVGPL